MLAVRIIVVRVLYLHISLRYIHRHIAHVMSE